MCQYSVVNSFDCFIGTKEQISVAKSLIDDIVEDYERSQMYLDSALARREPRLPPKSSESPKPTPDSPRSERISPLPGITYNFSILSGAL